MNENKNLLYEEKRILLLYRQMLRKEYDVNKQIKYENNNELQNHVEMQQAIYLAYNILWTDEYGFVWDTYGPKSTGLEMVLEDLDQKNNEILDYYNGFDNNIYSRDTIQKLKDYYDMSKIHKLEKFTKIVSDILVEEKGIELLADIAFLASKTLPGLKFAIVNRELQKLRPIFNNNELNKFAFRCLEEYDLINPIDESRGLVKRLK